MRGIYFVVEGHTEEAFVRELLRPYLFQVAGIHTITPIKISTSRGFKGGFVNYQHLRNDIIKLLNQQQDILVTTFVDFFRMPTSMPNYKNCLKKKDVNAQIFCLEQHLIKDINNQRFIPYIQKHEFESLLFSALEGYEFYEENIINSIQKIILQYPNPEDINNHPTTAPSKRLQLIFEQHQEKYSKTIDGIDIAELIGLEIMLQRCPHFRNWIKKLIKTYQEQQTNI